MPGTKLVSLHEAIARFVPDGSTVAMGTCLESLIPFAAGHEIMRQGKTGLTLVGPISDMLFDQIIGTGGAVTKIRAAWVGNVITGLGHNFTRAVDSGCLVVENHTNLTMAMALKAGAWGLPFLPTLTAMGADIAKDNPGMATVTCPFTGHELMAVAALVPDVTIVHAQRADVQGHAHLWGNYGVTREACLAARRVIVTAEQIVPPEVIRSDPNRVLVPGFRVAAVVHAPWGAHPSPVPGFYNRDHQVFLDYAAASRTEDGYLDWRRQWVEKVNSLEGYVRRLGAQRLEALRIRHPAPAEAVDYGY